MNPEPFLQLDRVIHEKGRLAIMSLLAASPELSFTEMRTALTPGGSGVLVVGETKAQAGREA